MLIGLLTVVIAIRDNDIIREVTTDARSTAISSAFGLFIIRLVLTLRKGAILVGKRPLHFQTRVDIEYKWKRETFSHLTRKYPRYFFFSGIEEPRNCAASK